MYVTEGGGGGGGLGGGVENPGRREVHHAFQQAGKTRAVGETWWRGEAASVAK